MGMKKMAKVTVLVLALCLVIPTMCWAGTANAVNVTATGSSTSYSWVKLSDTASPKAFPDNTWFYLDKTNVYSKTLLAAALTALSLGKTCQVTWAPGSPYSNLTAIYVNQ
jgi:hypothetical protein